MKNQTKESGRRMCAFASRAEKNKDCSLNWAIKNKKSREQEEEAKQE